MDNMSAHQQHAFSAPHFSLAYSMAAISYPTRIRDPLSFGNVVVVEPGLAVL